MSTAFTLLHTKHWECAQGSGGDPKAQRALLRQLLEFTGTATLKEGTGAISGYLKSNRWENWGRWLLEESTH